LSDLARREKENNEEQAKADVVDLLNLADEYVRFIGSVRGAFAGRVKSYMTWQAGEKEVGRLKVNRERLRQQNRLGERGPATLAEINEVSSTFDVLCA
jgi:sorting nexin-1/2